ncbi:DUF1624 domain-containing protein [Aliikangiella marina]|uniref:DUF1624 domain-containing protein n=1 Tax=Aliikangiella marina TaxID=1712262 RepID=A0A545TA43_9GAMM|nr:heparan-alpha-glucosaminide N-acetyltransferase [Aliikangiella marina]TQV74078.1 DUF1624 domain-containing protein [Aliikangiella marina]
MIKTQNPLVRFVVDYFSRPNKNRFEIVDVLRGLAVVQMMIFHFCFLLKEFRIAFLDFSYNANWAAFRIVIVTMFLSLVGVSLKIAWERGLKRKSYYRRLAQLFFYGLALSLTTYIIAPSRTVIFGILQFIFVASILGLVFVRLVWVNLILGTVIIWLGFNYANPIFNQAGLWWIGMVTRGPVTLDYVPLFPWFGLVLIGIFIGHFVVHKPQLAPIKSWHAKDFVSQTLALTGRHSLTLYMAHVPIFFVFIYLFMT